MEKLLAEFKDIIANYHIEEQIPDYPKYVIRTRIYLKDMSQLAAKDILIYLSKHSVKRKYAYQWMDEDNQLIIRWDNEPHHKHISTFPYHKHVGTDENVTAEPEVTLTEVLGHIRKCIRQQ